MKFKKKKNIKFESDWFFLKIVLVHLLFYLFILLKLKIKFIWKFRIFIQKSMQN